MGKCPVSENRTEREARQAVTVATTIGKGRVSGSFSDFPLRKIQVLADGLVTDSLPCKNPIMSLIFDNNLIRLFDFYLLLMFVIGLLRRYTFYKDIVILAVATVVRQPNLVRRLNANRDVLMNWPTMLPFFFAVFLMAVQFVMSRLIWPDATITGRDAGRVWWHAALLVALFVPMFGVDFYFLIRIGQIDRTEANKHLSRAEYWLTGWQAPTIRIITFGYVNPHRMVNEQLRENLTWFRGSMQWSLWWLVVQVGLRILFGVAVWLLWAWTIPAESV